MREEIETRRAGVAVRVRHHRAGAVQADEPFVVAQRRGPVRRSHQVRGGLLGELRRAELHREVERGSGFATTL